MNLINNPYNIGTKIYNLYEQIKDIIPIVYNNTNTFDKNLHLLTCVINTYKYPVVNNYIEEFLNLHPETIDVRIFKSITPLILAASDTITASSDRTVDILLRHGSNINIQDDKGCTALMISALNYEKDTVRILLNYKPNVNLKDNKGYTALFYAISASDNDQNLSVIKRLLDHGADVNLKDNEGMSALMFIDYSLNPIRTMKLILDYGHNINSQDNEGNTAYIHAIPILSYKNNIVDIFTQYNADINIENKHGENVITKVFEKNQVKNGKSLFDLILPNRRIFIKNMNINKTKILSNKSLFWKFGQCDFKIFGARINNFKNTLIFF